SPEGRTPPLRRHVGGWACRVPHAPIGPGRPVPPTVRGLLRPRVAAVPNVPGRGGVARTARVHPVRTAVRCAGPGLPGLPSARDRLVPGPLPVRGADPPGPDAHEVRRAALGGGGAGRTHGSGAPAGPAR